MKQCTDRNYVHKHVYLSSELKLTNAMRVVTQVALTGMRIVKKDLVVSQNYNFGRNPSCSYVKPVVTRGSTLQADRHVPCWAAAVTSHRIVTVYTVPHLPVQQTVDSPLVPDTSVGSNSLLQPTNVMYQAVTSLPIHFREYLLI
jgi:hypothetical protein